MVMGSDWCGEYASEAQPFMAPKITQEVIVRGVSQEHVDAVLSDAERRHTSALAAVASDRAQLSQRVSAAELALDNVRQDHQKAAAHVERLTQIEADLSSKLADVQAEMAPRKKTWRERLGI
jgi:hypothetical protein